MVVEPSGQITVYTGISPHGQGNATSFAQIVADALGISPSQVRVQHGDTAVVPFGERLGVPSAQTVATKPSRCSVTMRFMSGVSLAVTRLAAN